MKLILTVATLLVASTILTGCLDTDKPGNYPPSLMMERDSMPDQVDQKTDQRADQKTEQAITK
ncbi:hypothetical protein SAMN05216317_101158 [Nitrosomonas eutropha]|uniref:hypothetical protein n=1 Tax=Nitrosomonas TaxID=914 RepID=UPI000898B2E0|nr:MULTISPECIES: hypothetical protein [Nitrosomonas]MXS79931.1 hypothetical protein [Nitrosomonas sp. GH22]SDW02224.1 hypothetical protein SAMN05216317_101158 [Nitrosomonas eutropha]